MPALVVFRIRCGYPIVIGSDGLKEEIDVIFVTHLMQKNVLIYSQ
jgi:hypothetical protein